MPTLLAPKRTVNWGTPARARSSARVSFGRGKWPGSGEKVCETGSCLRSLFSTISCLASSSSLRDSDKLRNTSLGFVMTPSISPMPKKERVWVGLGLSGMAGRVRRRARLALELATDEKGRIEWRDGLRLVVELRCDIVVD